MPHRTPSPAVSENEVDISRALFHDGTSNTSDDEGQLQHPDRKARMLGPGDMPDLDGDFSSDDAGFIAETQAASNRKASNAKGKSIKGGGFQAMGLSATSLKAITRKGFSVPTPIQRKTIPLVLDGQDVVGMARTGSGKTGAFVIPMIERLKSHSAKVGARALILSPSRELALQTLKVVKELGRGTDLKCVLLVGGDSLEEQFSYVLLEYTGGLVALQACFMLESFNGAGNADSDTFIQLHVDKSRCRDCYPGEIPVSYIRIRSHSPFLNYILID